MSIATNKNNKTNIKRKVVATMAVQTSSGLAYELLPTTDQAILDFDIAISD